MSPICCIQFAAKATDRTKLAKRLIKDGNKLFFSNKIPAVYDASLPDLDFIIKGGDDAELFVLPSDGPPYNTSIPASQYPPRFRIPPTTLYGLSEEECKKRAQRFAVGCLIYTVMADKQPFDELDEEAVQHNFERGVYPEDTKNFPLEIALPILGFWSQEFAELIASQTNIFSKICSGIIVAGVGVLGLASLVTPALGIAGFSALGPVAGSAAAAWQSCIGLVQVGSLFAWCQSAAMGGAAAGTIFTAQGVGAGLAAFGAFLSGSKNKQAEMEKIWNLFVNNVRKVGGE